MNLSRVVECATSRLFREASGCLLKVISKTLGSILKACVTAVCSYKSYSASRKRGDEIKSGIQIKSRFLDEKIILIRSVLKRCTNSTAELWIHMKPNPTDSSPF